MFSNMTGELARVRQSELLAAAQYQRLVQEARIDRTGQFRHVLAALLVAAARQLEPVRRNLNLEPESIRLAPKLPCAIEPC
jgi:hypothetical protein